MRAPIEAVYGFARGADDIADEGDLGDAERLAGLRRYGDALDEIEAGRTPDEAPFARLAIAIREFHLPVTLLRDLLDAFRQDVVTKRYHSFADLLDYSRRSANPVGRLVLHVSTETGDRPLVPHGGTSGLSPVLQSDAICSALQLINFWQDVGVDWRKGRVYIPQEDLARFGVTEAHIAGAIADARWKELMAFECARTRDMLMSGAPLGRALPGRLGIEIRATVLGGAAILDKIEAAAGDVFRHRPVLGALDWMKILVKAVP